MIPIFDAPPAPRGLLFLATFSKRERAEIASSPRLIGGHPGRFAGRVARHHAPAPGSPTRRSPNACCDHPLDEDGLRQQALHDLQVSRRCTCCADRQS